MPIELETKKEVEDEARIDAAVQAERKRKARKANEEVSAWKGKVFVTFEHFGEPLGPLEQRIVEKGEALKSLKEQSPAEAAGMWFMLHNTSPLPISFRTDSSYLPRPNCGAKLSNGSTVGLCDGMEISIQYQIEEALGKRIPHGIDVSGLSVLAPGTAVLFSAPQIHLKNGRVISIGYSYMTENDKHELEEYGSPRRVRLRGSLLSLK